MSEDVFRQTRKKITPEEMGRGAGPGGPPPFTQPAEGNPLESVHQMRDAIARETGDTHPAPRAPENAPFAIGGNIPPEFREALMKRTAAPVEAKRPLSEPSDDEVELFEAPPDRPRPVKKATPDKAVRVQGTDELENLLARLNSHHSWEPFHFPSGGKFYSDIPGTVHIRAMTGEEEQILATPRHVRKGKAIDMIFKKCIREQIDTEQLLSVDRNHLLIYLRGISYTPEYDVEIKCPACSLKFPHVIDLNDLDVDACPAEFTPDSLQGTLPKSGFRFTYRLATGEDETLISQYREKRIQQFAGSDDDTLLYRTALLLEDIEGVTMKKELSLLLKKLPIQDVAYLRNTINQPPFGVNTEIPVMCPSCNEEFKIDLPLEANFFFPRKREEKTQA